MAPDRPPSRPARLDARTRLTPAPLPQAPLDAAQRLACLRLIRSDNVGPVTFRELINHFGGAEPALAALPELSRRGGRQRSASARAAEAEAELEAADRIGARPLFTIEPGYPPALAAVDAPPPLLYVKGDAAHLTRPMLAIVGARNGSAAGQKLARLFAARIGAAGFVIASGLARGIDAAAHEAALAPAPSPCWPAASTTSIRRSMPSCRPRIGERGCLDQREAAGLRAARAGLPPPQPHHLGHRAGRADRRGGAPFGNPDHGAHGRRAGPRGVRRARPSARSARGRHQPPAQDRGDHGDRARGRDCQLCCPWCARRPSPAVEAATAPAAPQPRRWRPSLLRPRSAAQDLARLLAALGPAPVDIDELARATGLPARALQIALIELALAGRIERHGHQLVSLASEGQLPFETL